MEKNQHYQSSDRSLSEKQDQTGGQQPGQQLPADQRGHLDQSQSATHGSERHSETSFPQTDEETLGTP